MRTQQEKADRFRALHPGEPFVIPNPWDAGSARLLEASASRRSRRRAPGSRSPSAASTATVTLDEVARTSPRWAQRPTCRSRSTSRTATARSRRARRRDRPRRRGRSRRRLDRGLRPRGHSTTCAAVERVAAAVEAARALDFPFMLTARAENHFAGTRPRRHDRATAGVRGGGRGRPLRARPLKV